jgi:hypothetical protein
LRRVGGLVRFAVRLYRKNAPLIDIDVVDALVFIFIFNSNDPRGRLRHVQECLLGFVMQSRKFVKGFHINFMGNKRCFQFERKLPSALPRANLSNTVYQERVGQAMRNNLRQVIGSRRNGSEKGSVAKVTLGGRRSSHEGVVNVM